MEPQEWLSELEARLAELPAASPASVSDDERDALLDLARVAAHTSERWTAPITTYLAGIAMAGLDPAERGAALRSLVERMG